MAEAVCSICKHPKRRQIEAALIAMQSLRSIAKQFDVSDSAVFRHKKKCLKDAVQAAEQEQQKAEQEQQLESGLSAADRLASGERITDAILAEAWNEKKKDPDLALRALAELRQQAKLRAEWQRDTAVEQMQERLKALEQQINDLYRARSA